MTYICEPKKEYMIVGKRIAGIQILLEPTSWQRSHVAQRFVDGEIGLETNVGSTEHPITRFTPYGKTEGKWHAIGEPNLPDHQISYDLNSTEGAALEVIAKQLPHQMDKIRANQREHGLPYRLSH